MEIELKFDKPIEEITLHKDSLQKYFSYLVLNRISHSIKSPGWKIHPITAQSSNRDDNCIKFFDLENNKLKFEIKWEQKK
jgi:hypothetical protein